MSDRVLYSRAEAATYIGVSQSTIDVIIARGLVRARRIGRRVLIHRTELDNFVKADHVRIWPKKEKGKTARHIAACVAVVLVFIFAGGFSGFKKQTYLDRLAAFEGAPYSRLTCSAFICEAKRARDCKAREMFEGCGGALEIVQDVDSKSAIDVSKLRAGDVADFSGSHVAAYIGNNVWMDSDPQRGGVGRFDLASKPAGDKWFNGRVRILRWTR